MDRLFLFLPNTDTWEMHVSVEGGGVAADSRTDAKGRLDTGAQGGEAGDSLTIYHIAQQDFVLLFIHTHQSTGWLINLSNKLEIGILLTTSFAYAEPPAPGPSPLAVDHSSQHRCGGPTLGGS